MLSRDPVVQKNHSILRTLFTGGASTADLLASAFVTLVGLSLTLGLVKYSGYRQRQIDQVQLAATGRQIDAALQSELEVPLEILRSIPAVYGATGPFTREKFSKLLHTSISRHPGVYAVQWAPFVLANERDLFEKNAQQEGFAGYQIVEPALSGAMLRAAERTEYMPLLYTEPVPTAQGFDILCEINRKNLSMTARDSGEMLISPKFQLIEDKEDIASIAVYLPVYEGGAPPDTLEKRQALFRGMAIEVFRLRTFVDAATKNIHVGALDFVILDKNAPVASQLLYENRTGAGQRVLAGSSSNLRWSFPRQFGSRTWELVISANVGFAGGYSGRWGLLAIGAAMSLFAGAAMYVYRAIKHLRAQVQVAVQLGQYTLDRKLGSGGMGSVYLAHHAMLRRPTAIKLLLHSSERAIARFEQEVQMTANLSHPNTVSIFDFGRTPEGTFYYAMEYIDGVNLEQLVKCEGPLPEGRVIHILEQICGALSEAHSAGIIHRDIKPSNIMICVRGGLADFVKVLDFGLVKAVQSPMTETPSVALSVEGAVLGTPLYLSPEAIKAPSGVEQRSDLYAVGCVGYFLLTGKPPFWGTTNLEVCSKHLTESPVPPSKARPGGLKNLGLEQLILSCLEKDIERRPRSAHELLRLLAELGDRKDWDETAASTWWDTRAESVKALAKKETDSGPVDGLGVTMPVQLQGRGNLDNPKKLLEKTMRSSPTDPVR